MSDTEVRDGRQLVADGAIQFRQGDLLIEKINRLPPKTKRAKDKIIAYGEVTGHKHVAEGNCAVLDAGTEKIAKAGGNWRLVHDEHNTILLPDGIYSISRQQEYSPEEIRVVAD